MTGSITALSYFNLVITGECTGRLKTDSYAMVYLLSGLGGAVELDGSKVYVKGETLKEDLACIRGRGHVYLEQSDLNPGTHKIGNLTVTVGK
jgi:hypothetical protein